MKDQQRPICGKPNIDGSLQGMHRARRVVLGCSTTNCPGHLTNGTNTSRQTSSVVIDKYIKTNGKQEYVGSIQDRNGVLETDRKCIADVSADFYEKLITCGSNIEVSMTVDNRSKNIPERTDEEITRQMQTMSNGKCPDSR